MSNGLGTRRADLMFRTTAEAKGKSSDQVKHVKAPFNLLLTFQGGTSVSVSPFFMLLCPCVYGPQK